MQNFVKIDPGKIGHTFFIILRKRILLPHPKSLFLQVFWSLNNSFSEFCLRLDSQLCAGREGAGIAPVLVDTGEWGTCDRPTNICENPNLRVRVNAHFNAGKKFIPNAV